MRYTRAIELDPNDAVSYNNRAVVWEDKREYAKAIADLNRSLQIDADNSMTYVNRAEVWSLMGEFDKAIADCDSALRLDPQDTYAQVSRGLAQLQKKDFPQALADCDRALKLDPGYAYAWESRGLIHAAIGEYGKAVADYTRALRLDPKRASTFRLMGWLRATCPDDALRDAVIAFGNASRAYELSDGSEWEYCDTLAAAYAESGDFKQAATWENKAIALAKDEASKQICRARLELYQAKMPYRERPQS